MDLNQIAMNLFLLIGMAVCVVVTAVTLVYGFFFIIRLLVKTFSVKVASSCDIIADDLKAKSAAKKQRKKECRDAKLEQKAEVQKLKLESIARIGEMKRQKYQEKLIKKENKKYEKIFGEPNPNPYQPPKKEVKYNEAVSENVVEDEPVYEQPQDDSIMSQDVEMTPETQMAVEEMTFYGTEEGIVLRGDKIVEEDSNVSEFKPFSIPQSENVDEAQSETTNEVDEFKKEYFETLAQDEAEETEISIVDSMLPPPPMEQPAQSQPKKRGRKKKIVTE